MVNISIEASVKYLQSPCYIILNDDIIIIIVGWYHLYIALRLIDHKYQSSQYNMTINKLLSTFTKRPDFGRYEGTKRFRYEKSGTPCACAEVPEAAFFPRVFASACQVIGIHSNFER